MLDVKLAEPSWTVDGVWASGFVSYRDLNRKRWVKYLIFGATVSLFQVLRYLDEV